jgi:protoporphyrinogen oxidase
MKNERQSETSFVVIGGGPAGLTAALELTDHGFRPTVLEQTQLVGGIARTENYKGFRFDMGGHRFFTKSDQVRELWHRILGNHFLKRPRLSRIFYNKKFFSLSASPTRRPGEARSVRGISDRPQLFPLATFSVSTC